jgi:hypothetical protein
LCNSINICDVSIEEMKNIPNLQFIDTDDTTTDNNDEHSNAIHKDIKEGSIRIIKNPPPLTTLKVSQVET